MNLYLIKRTDSCDYDQYDSAVVASESEEDAKTIHPSGGRDYDGELSSYLWTTPQKITVELIGTAKPFTKRGVICASFNAG